MRFTVTEPGQPPYDCTMPVESVPFLIQNGFLVVPNTRDTRELERYREILNGACGPRRDVPSARKLQQMEE